MKILRRLLIGTLYEGTSCTQLNGGKAEGSLACQLAGWLAAAEVLSCSAQCRYV